MLQKAEIEQFYKDVKALDLKFPVAAISEATGQSKSNVSKYLSRKLEPSESFLKAFYERFPKNGKIVSRETLDQEIKIKSPLEVTVEDYGALLSVLMHEVAEIKASILDGNAAVELKKLYKAAEELKKIGRA
jgi:hypothetical protein